ncbi:MAG: endolytic transglycosylase MltG [Chitinophagaceae bacterium]
MRFVKYFFLFFVLVAAAAIWFVLIGNKASFNQKEKKIIITDVANKDNLLALLKDEGCFSNSFCFELLANNMNVFEKVKPGKFVIKNGTTPLQLARLLRNNQQASVKLVINKIRTLGDFVQLISKNFDKDSVLINNEFNDFFNNNSLGVNASNFQAYIIPNTYEFFWNSSVEKIMKVLIDEQEKFWQQNNRQQLLTQLGFNKIELITIASIVEEETNYNAEKGNIASVYINRLDKKMKLGADPTIKFALNDFTLKRILNIHLQVSSPYNTYKNAGLPPGPICTPSIKTIDATLNAPRTNYLFFVASDKLNGTHIFTTNYSEHEQYAKLYREAVTKFLATKK